MSSVVISGDTSGTITLSAPAVSGTNTITLPAATGTMVLTGTSPTFGTVTASTISDGTNSTSATNPIRGSAKAWVNFQGGNGNTAGTINTSFNVSSITVNGTGDYTANFTTAMPSANIVIAGSCKESDLGVSDGVLKIGEFASNPSTTTVRVVTGSVSTSVNMQLVMLAVFTS